MAGRKGFYDEKSMGELVHLSVRTVKSFLNSPEYSLKEKAEIAKHFAVKAMPQKIEGNLDLSIQTINYGEIESSTSK